MDITQVIVAALGGGALTALISKLNTLRSEKRKGDAEAERLEIENDDIRFESYKKTINYLNERLEKALSQMNELEDALNKSNTVIIELKGELLQSRSVIKGQQIEIEDLKAENEHLRNENENLRTKLEEAGL